MTTSRPRAAGKFICVGAEKLWVRGVTDGPTPSWPDRPTHDDLATVGRHFAELTTAGVNTVRVPGAIPTRPWLDLASRHGLYLIVGLPADPELLEVNRSRVRDLAGHPALLLYEIARATSGEAASRVARVFRAIKQEDPDALVAYLDRSGGVPVPLPFLDVLSFAIELKAGEGLDACIARLHNVAGVRPVIVSEPSLDRSGADEAGARAGSDGPVRSAFAEGCAGVLVPTVALPTVRRAFAEVPLPSNFPLPRISVVVCVFNGARTIRDTLDGLRRLDYPDFEVIVIDDGSTDATPTIAGGYDVRLISTANQGLSCARNTGWQAASGEIVAYIDDDAWPDPHWLQYLAYRFSTGDYVGVGGPNIPPPQGALVAACVASAGGPTHVLVADRDAMHLAGVNMAFRRSALAAIEGFDSRYRVAGDDGDVCLRLLNRSWRLGYHAGAMDWHHPRHSIRGYWRQQVGYGKAEVLLKSRWPRSYDRLGRLMPPERFYGDERVAVPTHITLKVLPLMPEWFLLVGALGILSLLGLVWKPLLWALAPLALAVGATLFKALRRAFYTHVHAAPWLSGPQWVARVLVTAAVQILQPLARLVGRTKQTLAGAA